MKVTIDRKKVLEHLSEQYRLLKKACIEYDKGDRFEAKNIANRIRIFTYNSKSCYSLIKQVGLVFGKGLRIKTYQDPIPTNTLLFISPTVRMSSDELHFVPTFDFGGRVLRELDYREWLDEVQLIIPSKAGRKVFTRADVIFTYTDQDGGVHVDPKIDYDYKKLTEGDLLQVNGICSKGRIKNPSKEIPEIVVREGGLFLTSAIEEYYKELLTY